MTPRRILLALTVLVLTLVGAGPAAAAGGAGAAAPGPDDAVSRLALRYAPVIQLRTQHEPCGPGEPYLPLDVDALMSNPEVALDGPWTRHAIVTVAPTATDLARGLPGYHLDFPGDALHPGCGFEEFSKRMSATTPPTVYAHVTGEAGHPHQLALQYWIFYVYNDFNNKHEGDWEMIQLDFRADDAAAALQSSPVEVGYSQHESAESARWDDPKLQKVDGTHPVVYVADGSHANFFRAALFLGRTGAQGVGCDDTVTPHTTVRPQVDVVPTDATAAVAAYPWLGFQGRWGEQQPAFFNGPTGPNMKEQWTEPFTWSSTQWRSTSFSVPLATRFGPNATSFFCSGVAAGSDALRHAVSRPGTALVVLGLLVALVLLLASRTRWTPASPEPLIARRAWGQILVSARRAYGTRPWLYIGIGLAYLGAALLAGTVQALLFHLTRLSGLRAVAGSRDGYVIEIVLGIGAVFSVLAFVVVLAATSSALAGLDAGERVTLRTAYQGALARVRPLAQVTGIVVPVLLVLSGVVVLLPVAAVVLVRRLWAVHAVVIERLPARAALRSSRVLVSGRWWPTAALLALVGGIGALTGPLAGVALLFATSASFSLVNVVASVVYVVTIPYVALALTYLYADLRARADG